MVDKNRKKEQAKQNRVWFPMNTGTITHKSKRHKSRQENKKDLQKLLDNKDY